MTFNMLRLNDKTELMLVTSKRTRHPHSLPTLIIIGNALIPFKQTVKNLGFTLDCHLTMNAHVSNIALTCYFNPRCLASIRRFLTSTATATLVSSFVLPRIDYWISLLLSCTHDVTSLMQRIQNYAAEADFSHVNIIWTRQRNSFNLQIRGDLRLQHQNFQPNVYYRDTSHQAQSSH